MAQARELCVPSTNASLTLLVRSVTPSHWPRASQARGGQAPGAPSERAAASCAAVASVRCWASCAASCVVSSPADQPAQSAPEEGEPNSRRRGPLLPQIWRRQAGQGPLQTAFCQVLPDAQAGRRRRSGMRLAGLERVASHRGCSGGECKSGNPRRSTSGRVDQAQKTWSGSPCSQHAGMMGHSSRR